jgi:hypothetical protein
MGERMFARLPDGHARQGAAFGCYRPDLRAAIV